MIQCEGQMSLMDLLTPVATGNEPPRLLSAGQTVYKVVRGDVEECIVGERTWACGTDNRGYDLDKGVTWNTQIDEVVFTEREPAERVAEQYLLENEHILGKDIRATRVVAYRYKYYDREVINFYAVLGNGDVYFRYGSMYQHIGKKDEIKEFEKARSKHIESAEYEELSDFQPEYKTMYKRKHKSWLYAEAGFEYFSVT